MHMYIYNSFHFVPEACRKSLAQTFIQGICSHHPLSPIGLRTSSHKQKWPQDYLAVSREGEQKDEDKRASEERERESKLRTSIHWDDVYDVFLSTYSSLCKKVFRIFLVIGQRRRRKRDDRIGMIGIL